MRLHLEGRWDEKPLALSEILRPQPWRALVKTALPPRLIKLPHEIVGELAPEARLRQLPNGMW